MDDRISALPDTVLCYILSFLPTKLSVSTSVLSKRWKPLWRSVPTLDFNLDNFVYKPSKEKNNRFVRSVYAVIQSRDLHQPIQTFRLRCCFPLFDLIHFNIWVNAALQRRVEHLDLSLPTWWHGTPWSFNLPSAIFSHRTLVVFKLVGSTVKSLSSIDFPSLKILHLVEVCFSQKRCLAELLSGCPVLQDFEANDILFDNYLNVAEFKRSPKLIRANIHTFHIPLEVVNNMEFFRVNKKIGFCIGPTCFKDFIPVFHNLIHLELNYFDHTTDWLEVVQMLKHCPKLQNLVIHQERQIGFREGGYWSYPKSIPKSISLHLKSCRLTRYHGSKGELRFARYIMQNARHLHSMTIDSRFATNNRKAKLKMIKKLSLCTRRCPTCKLSFM